MGLRDVPAPAIVLGFGGLIPFYGCALGVWLTASPEWSGYLLYVQVAYGACIASFIGAVHWGLALAWLMRERERRPVEARANDGGDGAARTGPAWRLMGLSVLPALIAWVALLLTPVYALCVLILLFAVLFFQDRVAIRDGLAPGWYGSLRKPLTLLVIVAFGASLARLMAVGA